MTNLWIILGVSLGVSLVSFSGMLLSVRLFRRSLERYQTLFVSFAAGVFLVAGSTLAIETVHVIDNITLTVAVLIASVLVFHGLSSLFPEHHHHHTDEDCCETATATPQTARRMLIADSVHNIADGLLIVSAFTVDTRIGLITTVGIILHEFVQEVSEYIVYRQAGFSPRKAFTWNFVSALSIFVGVAIGLFATTVSVQLEGYLLAFAAGAFLYIVFKDLIPHSVMYSRGSSRVAQHVIIFIVGIGVMAGISSVGEHTHQESDHSHVSHSH